MAKKHNIIFKRQNEIEMQTLVKTQHFTYKSAKRWSGIQFVLLVIIPILCNVVLYFNVSEIIIGVISLSSVVVLILGEITKNVVQSRRSIAAMIQQKFDLYVFNMDRISVIDENLIELQIEKYKSQEWHRMKNWYENYEGMDTKKVIFYCQKENIDWTGNLSKKYQNFLYCIIFFALLSFVINFVLSNSSVVKMFSIVLVALPLLTYGLTSYSKIKMDETNFYEIKNLAKRVNNSVNEISLNKLSNLTYALQILIFRHRQSRFLIPDWFEERHFKHLQAVERRKKGQRLKREKEMERNNLDE